jgi:RNA polymerase sigma-70 factor (ECF subfamily)
MILRMGVPSANRKGAGNADGAVARLPLHVSDVEILGALHARSASGGAALYDRYHRHVRRVLIRVLGPNGDLNDLVQDVFVTAINTIDRVVGPESLRPWVTSIAVFTARDAIRRRNRRRFLLLTPSEDLPETEAPVPTPELDEALRTTYRVLSKMPADERIAFALRFIDGMELVEVAGACRVSLATIKRRVQRSRQRFVSIASQYDALSEWLGRDR